MTLRDIAEATGVDAPYATVIVDKLVSRGLVERTAHPDDNRRKLVKLTASGREAAALAEQILAEPSPATRSSVDIALLNDEPAGPTGLHARKREEGSMVSQ